MKVQGFDGGFSAAGVIPLRWEKGRLSLAAVAEGEVLDASGMIVLPGLVWGHSQIGSSLGVLPGLRGELPPARARRLADLHDEASLFALARLAALNAARAGVTLIFDLWQGLLPLGPIIDAAEEVGIRVVVSAAVDEGRGLPAATAALQENLRVAALALPKVGAMMGVADTSAVPTLLPSLVAEARRREMGMHLILGGEAEARRSFAERGGFRPGSIAVLSGELDHEERGLLVDLHLWPVVTAGVTQAGLGGRLVLGGREGLIDPFQEAARLGDPLLLSAGQDLAAEVFDLPFGRLTPGAPADLVVLEAALPLPPTAGSFPAHLGALSARHVRHVVCDGELIIRDGRPTRVDEEEVRRKAREHATRIAKGARY